MGCFPAVSWDESDRLIWRRSDEVCPSVWFEVIELEGGSGKRAALFACRGSALFGAKARYIFGMIDPKATAAGSDLCPMCPRPSGRNSRHLPVSHPAARQRIPFMLDAQGTRTPTLHLPRHEQSTWRPFASNESIVIT